MDINKNIKKMRTEKKLTQEELAQKINVTRQAVSNWENAKTQPDLETLISIAEALQVDFEALLYGKKYVKADGNTENTKKLSGIKIVLSVVGTVFIAVGLVFMFFNFWEDFPDFLKVILSAVPLLAAQGFAIFVLIKKYGSASWRECAGTAISIGVISTVALINSVLDIHCGTENCLVIDSILCIPAVFLFDAVVPLAVCFGMAVFMSTYGYILPAVLFILICTAFTVYNRKKVYDTRYLIGAFVNLLAVELFAVCSALFQNNLYAGEAATMFLPIALIFPFAVALIPFNTDSVFAVPVKIFSLFGSLIVMVSMIFVGSAILESEKSYLFFAIPLVILLCAYGVCYYLKYRDSDETDAFTVASGISVAAWMINYLVCFLPLLLNHSDKYSYGMRNIEFFWSVSCLIAVVYAVCVIADGMINISFLKVNLGLIAGFINLMIGLQLFSPDVFEIGISLLLFGAALIGVNVYMAYRKKNEEEEEIIVSSEVTENEEK